MQEQSRPDEQSLLINMHPSEQNEPSPPDPPEQPHIASILHNLEAVKLPELKPDALEYDIKLGWLPRSQITGPIPLSYQHELYDQVIEDNCRNLVYVGHRHGNTFDLHRQFYAEGRQYPFHQFHLCKSQFLQRFFRKQYPDYAFSDQRDQLTVGEYPLRFEADFEGGNLDAVYFQEEEYRLMLRVDSNTVGHCHYFNFKVTASEAGRRSFRIMNITRTKSLYMRGLRPYVRRLTPTPEPDFKQSCQSVRFLESPLTQTYALTTPLRSLKFDFTFPEPGCYQFSYCIPYVYSDLLRDIRSFRSSGYCHVGKLCHSLSGVEIPLLTVTEGAGEREDAPFVVAVVGRVHPSEAGGSHVVNGIIRQLMRETPEMKFLRARTIFKIIPMLNPDGVIAGNARTSFAGKDLNRRYTKAPDFVFPEVTGVIDYLSKLKARYGDRLLFLLDIHGHSARKNSFFYGPEYSIISEEYSRCRLLPKLYAQRTDVFRYYSCKFKVTSYKESTARGYFNSVGVRTYTHETSAHCFFDFGTRRDQPFTRGTLEKLGEDLASSVYDYVRMIGAGGREKAGLKEQMEKVLPLREGKGEEEREERDEREEQSDGESSRGADSEDEVEDVPERTLQQFYSRINENRQYFYEELLAMQGGNAQSSTPTPDKKIQQRQQQKRKKSEVTRQQQANRASEKLRVRLQEELVLKKQGERVDWAAKVSYPEKKKYIHRQYRQFQEYGKLSSVIFGSNIPPAFFGRENSPKGRQADSPRNLPTRYSIKFIEAQFDSTVVKYPSPEPKLHKPMIRQNTQKTVSDASGMKEMEKRKVQRYLQLKEESGQQSKPAIGSRTTAQEMERLLSRPSEYQTVKPLPVCAVDLGLLSREKKQEQRDVQQASSSLKVLTRKRSIKNIRESEPLLARKVSRSLKLATLTKRLPSLHALANNF